jgi:hypothetical protein
MIQLFIEAPDARKTLIGHRQMAFCNTSLHVPRRRAQCIPIEILIRGATGLTAEAPPT